MHGDLLFKLDTDLPAQTPTLFVGTIFKSVADHLKQVSNQPSSIAALMALRQAKQTLDNAIKQHEDDKSFVAQLFLLATEENNLVFIKFLQERYERQAGKAAVDDLFIQYCNQQGQSLFAFAVARHADLSVIQYFIDVCGLATLVKQHIDDGYIEKLLFRVVASNNCQLLTAIRDELAKAFDQSSTSSYLNNCCNALGQSLLSYGVVEACSQNTLAYLVENWRLPITQEVIINALHSKNEIALQYFITQLDTIELSSNKLVWLSNVLTAYANQYGTNTFCEVYQAQIATRRQARQLFLTFEKEAVAPNTRPILSNPSEQEAKQSLPDTKQETLPSLEQRRKQVTHQLQQAERSWEKVTYALQAADSDKQRIAFELKQLAEAKKYVAAETEAKQILSRTEQWRLSWNPDGFISRGIHWLLDRFDVPSRVYCQHKQETIVTAKRVSVI